MSATSCLLLGLSWCHTGSSCIRKSFSKSLVSEFSTVISSVSSYKYKKSIFQVMDRTQNKKKNIRTDPYASNIQKGHKIK